jgi:hypothetical protein
MLIVELLWLDKRMEQDYTEQYRIEDSKNPWVLADNLEI